MLRLPAYLVGCVSFLLLIAACSGDSEEVGEKTERTTADEQGAPAWTNDPLRTTPSPGIREPGVLYGYTYGRPSGNRTVEGRGRLPESRPVDARLGGEPIWVVGVQMEGDDIAWVVALGTGRLEAFRLDGESGEIEPWLAAPDESTAGTPPLIVAQGERLYLISPTTGSSTLTHPVPLVERPGARLLTIAEDGRLSVEPGEDPLPVLALPDARATRSANGTLAILSDPTGSYDHGVLGDDLEAENITLLKTGESPEILGEISPESGGVFELLTPVWFETGGPESEELRAVTESRADAGSRISAYRPDGSLAAAGPFVGEPMRWRHLLAAGPFGPNGEVELAVTRTPHTDPVTEFYRPNLQRGELTLAASGRGYLSHTLYSRNLDAVRAGDLDGDGRWELLLPGPGYDELIAIRHARTGVETAWTLPIGGNLSTNIASATGVSGKTSVAVGRTDGVLRVWP
jgi:hypothetical protein